MFKKVMLSENIRQFDVKGMTLMVQFMHIRKICPRNIYPLIPYFNKAKLWYASDAVFLIFVLKIDCGYLLEPPQRGGSNV